MSNLQQIIELCKQIADELDKNCLPVDNTAGVEGLLSILDGKERKDILTWLSLYHPAEAQKLEKEFEQIKKWAISLYYSTPYPFPLKDIDFSQSVIDLSKSDYPLPVIENIIRLQSRVPQIADELRRVAKLLAEDQKQIIEPQKTSGQNKVKEPSKEAAQAYTLYYGTDKTQSDVAGIMSKKLKRSVKQGQVSRWVTRYKKWREAEGIPVDDTRPNIIVNSNILDMGARTDGRLTGDPRHKKNTDYKH